MDEYDVYREAINQWGEDSQLQMFYEEVGELMTAISQHKRGRVPIKNVIEEIVDVKIMIEQMRIIFDKSPDFQVSTTMYTIKLWRLEDMLKFTGDQTNSK